MRKTTMLLICLVGALGALASVRFSPVRAQAVDTAALAPMRAAQPSTEEISTAVQPHAPVEADQQGAAIQAGGSSSGLYNANPLPLPPPPDPAVKAARLPRDAPIDAATLNQDECADYIVNPSFETTGGWFGQPASNVGFNTVAWNSGSQSVFFNTNYFSNAAIWQPVRVPANVEAATLYFYSGIAFIDPQEIIYISVYDATFTELIYWDYLLYNALETWLFFGIDIPAQRVAGRDIQVVFQLAQDYDAFYTEVLLDDVSLMLCSTTELQPPTPVVAPTSTATRQPATSTPTPAATATLLPTNTPTGVPPTSTPVAGSPQVDLSVAGIQVGQALLADADPVTGAAVPLIAQKPLLARAYANLEGVASVADVDARLFVRDAGGTVHQVESVNGPIALNGDSIEGDARTTLNFLVDVAWLTGSVDFWVEIDPAGRIAEANEGNNTSSPITRVFQPGKKVRIAWVEANPGVNREIAQNGDSDLRKFYPVGVNDVEYFFQPGFDQPLNALLSVQNYSDYFNALNRFWDRMTHEGRWVGGRPPDRLYGWTGGQPSGLCGVADALWAGGRGRVAVGYALDCGAETFAHEVGHIFDNVGLRHSPNQPPQQDRNCVGQPAGPDPAYPNYPALATGSIGVTGFDATRLQLLMPGQTYDFMSYCEPSWISPFNYNRIHQGFGPTAAVVGSNVAAESAKLLVSGLVYTGTVTAELDPFYLIRSEVGTEPSSGTDYCIELRDADNSLLENRCFDLGFVDVETGLPSDVDGFSLVMPYPQATTQIRLTHDGAELAARAVTANQPFVRLTSPTSGAVLAGSDKVTVTWNAADLDDDQLFYSLAYSTDAGASWLPLATDLTTTSYVVDLARLPGSAEAQFRVSASDGVNTAYAASGSLEIGFIGDSTLTVSGKPPVASIRTTARQVEPGSALILEGTGYDLEDGLLPEEELRWWSNRDGELGRGSWLQSTLSAGRHKITLTVTDSDGGTNTATLSISVGQTEQKIYLPLLSN